MYCKNCGKEVSNDDRFCEYCGYATGDSKETVTEKKKANRKKIIVIVAAALAVAIAVGIFLAWKSFMIGGASSREGAFKKMVQANIDEDYEALNMMTFPKKYEDEYFSFLMAEYGSTDENVYESVETKFE